MLTGCSNYTIVYTHTPDLIYSTPCSYKNSTHTHKHPQAPTTLLQPNYTSQTIVNVTSTTVMSTQIPVQELSLHVPHVSLVSHPIPPNSKVKRGLSTPTPPCPSPPFTPILGEPFQSKSFPSHHHTHILPLPLLSLSILNLQITTASLFQRAFVSFGVQCNDNIPYEYYPSTTRIYESSSI